MPRAALVYWLHCTPAIPKVLWADTEAVDGEQPRPGASNPEDCFMVPVTPPSQPTDRHSDRESRPPEGGRGIGRSIEAEAMPHQGRRRLRKAGLVDLKQDAQSVVFHHSLALIVFRRKRPGPNQFPRGRIDAGAPGNRTVLFRVGQPANGVHQTKKIAAGEFFIGPTQQLGGVRARARSARPRRTAPSQECLGAMLGESDETLLMIRTPTDDRQLSGHALKRSCNPTADVIHRSSTDFPQRALPGTRKGPL